MPLPHASTRLASLVLIGFGLWAPAAIAHDLPIRVQPIELETPIGPARGWAAEIDLTHPAIEIVVTDPTSDEHEADRVSTQAWAREHDITLAINANFYATIGDQHADIIGLSVSDGVVISPARTRNGRPDPALVFDKDGTARVLRCDPCEHAWDAVAGVGGSSSPDAPNALLLEDGVNHAAHTRAHTAARHPRTGAGVSADGETLYLVVIDGRQIGWSVGVTLEELAETLKDLGADDALNLDGGGSSSFLSRVSESGERHETFVITNRPSEARFRPVANHLGVRLRTAPVNDTATRPADDHR